MVDQPLFVRPCRCRDSAERGTGDGGRGGLFTCHDRLERGDPAGLAAMPVLRADEWNHCVHGSFEDAQIFHALCFPGHLIAMERTSEAWVKQRLLTIVPALT